MLPYWHDVIVPDLLSGRLPLVVAHGNSIRALVKHLDGMSDEEIVELNIPTGLPLVYQLDDSFQPVSSRYLGDAAAAAAALAPAEAAALMARLLGAFEPYSVRLFARPLRSFPNNTP